MERKIKTQQVNVAKFVAYCEAVITMPEPNLTKGYLEAKNKVISEMFTKLDKANDEISDGVGASDIQSDYFTKNEFDKAFALYDKVMIKIQAKLEKLEKASTQPATINVPPNMILSTDKPKLKLKPIDIPIFSGDYKKWISFRSVFDSMVHNDNKIDKLEKMYYLKASLTKDAERIISQFDTTAEAYDDAYAAVTERFHNEVILVDTHIINILSQSTLTTESGNNIKELMDRTTENLRALKSLKIEVDTWDPILLLLLVQKLDTSTRRLWEQTLKPKVRPTMKEFLEFLSTRYHALGCQQKFNFSMETRTEGSQSKYQRHKRSLGNESFFSSGQNFPPRVHQTFLNTAKPNQRRCPFGCGENHYGDECENFHKAEMQVKIDLVRGAKLCRNCLKGHAGTCTSRPGCGKCGRYHHTSLHFEQSDPRRVTTNSSSDNTTQATANDKKGQRKSLKTHHTRTQAEIHEQSHNGSGDSDVVAWDEPILLATAIVLIRSERDNILYPFRALLDQASEASYITENVLQFLGLKKKRIIAATSGLGGVKTGEMKGVVDFEIGSKRNQMFRMKVQAPVVRKISNTLPSTRLETTDWEHIKDLELADPDFRTPGKIDILLGAPVYGYLLLPGLVKVSPTTPVAQNTEFGWIVSGATRSPTRNLLTFHLKLELEDQLKKFFEQEEVSKERIFTQEESECEKLFEETVKRDEEGRYVVALPFKKDPELLGSSKGQALERSE